MIITIGKCYLPIPIKENQKITADFGKIGVVNIKVL